MPCGNDGESPLEKEAEIACADLQTWPGVSVELPHKAFIRAWCSVAYLFPGLHPDGYEDTDSGWPRVLRRFAAEAWRRADAGELADEELYPSNAQWCGLYDRMFSHKPDETKRRLALAANYGGLV